MKLNSGGAQDASIPVPFKDNSYIERVGLLGWGKRQISHCSK